MRVLISKAVALLGAATLILAACGSNAAPSNPGAPTAVGAEAPTQAGAASAAVTSKPLSGTGPVTAIAAGGGQTCALISDGSVMCWGTNYFGEFGNGATSSNPQTNTPVRVAGLTGATAITASNLYTCGLTSGGGVKCWGGNTIASLGNGSTLPSLTPVDVVGLTGGAKAISASETHACAVTSGGGVKCWGANGSGELGVGNLSTLSSTVALTVSGLTSGVIAIAASEGYTCALTSLGGVKCWGGNGSGQLGNGTTTGSLAPVDVAGLTSGVSAIVAGAGYNCARTSAGGVKCWGGTGAASSSVAVDVAGLTSGVSAIAMGSGQACAVLSAGVKCWDSNNRTPIDLAGLSGGVTAISLGGSNTCALTSAGGVKCLNRSNTTPGFVDIVGLTPGQSVVQAPSSSASPATGNATAIAAGSRHICSITKTGGVKCWGFNTYGQLGNGSTANSGVPVDVFGLTSGVAAIGAGNDYSCAITSAGGVKCWGKNDTGQLGNGTSTNSLIPVDVSGLASGVTAIALGNGACALTNKGAVKCWPTSVGGRIVSTPIDVSGLQSGVTAIAVGGAQVCVITSAGGVKCGGFLGGSPVDVPGLTTGVTAIAAGQGLGYVCAAISGGGVKCLGDNHSGQLGVNVTPSFVSSATPVAIPGLTSVTAIAAGLYHVCALSSGGGVMCWGEALLGDGTSGRSATGAPVDVFGLTTGVAAIGAGRDYSCALTNSGVVKCWGNNSAGTLVNTKEFNVTTPVDIAGL